jgi:hypothetical protein
MFSGQTPFDDIQSEWSIPPTVKNGKRPFRPVHDLSKIRGLTDGIWNLMETCWDQDPGKRPIASQVVNELRFLPSRPIDERSLDNITFPSLVLSMHNPADHPFAALSIGQFDSEQIRDLKHISKDQSIA